MPDYGYFFPNYIEACPAIRVSIINNGKYIPKGTTESDLKPKAKTKPKRAPKEESKYILVAEACVIDVATVESFEIQLMVPPFTPRKTWTRDSLFKATSRLTVGEAKDQGDCVSFGDCEPLDDEEAKRMFLLLNHYDWVHSKPTYEWQANRLKEVGFNIDQRNVKTLIDSMKIAVLRDGKHATVTEARSTFLNAEVRSTGGGMLDETCKLMNKSFIQGRSDGASWHKTAKSNGLVAALNEAVVQGSSNACAKLPDESGDIGCRTSSTNCACMSSAGSTTSE